MKLVLFIILATLGLLASGAIYQSSPGAGTTCAGISFLIAGVVTLAIPRKQKEKK